MALKCPFCNYNDTKVIDSRGQEDNSVIRRRRLCESCGKRFTTYERIDMIPITVIKKDGTREIFDKTKIINGVMKSCNKRPVTAQQIQELADDIENTLMGLGEREVESKQIGNMVMDRLKEVDEVAYVRFASVYRQFKDINTFIDELEKLLVEKNAAGEELQNAETQYRACQKEAAQAKAIFNGAKVNDVQIGRAHV